MTFARRFFTCQATSEQKHQRFAYGMLLGVWLYIIADGKVF